MTWSGRDVLLAELLPRFHDRQLALDSLAEYIRTAHVLDDRYARTWLERDLQRDQELAAIASDTAERAVPRPSLFVLGQCYHCAGRGHVRLDVDPGHPEFGKAKPCPACSTSSRNPAEHCEKCAAEKAAHSQDSERNQCWKCGAFQDQPAGEKCGNPRWHDPNWRMPVDPTLEPRDYPEFLGKAWSA
jgi:hypothetical protein